MFGWLFVLIIIIYLDLQIKVLYIPCYRSRNFGQSFASFVFCEISGFNFKNEDNDTLIFICHQKKITFPIPIYRMNDLLKPSPGQKYVDLIVSFDNDDGEDVPGPPVRYYF